MDCSSSKERISKNFLQRILDLFERCRAGELGFTQAEFCELVTGIARRTLGERCTPREQAKFIEGLYVKDLVLAHACARGHEPAWEQFLSLYREILHRTAMAVTREESAARELADSVYADLFGTRVREDGTRVSKLESYSGRGPLEGWLKAVLAQEHINRIRREQNRVAFDEAIAQDRLATSLQSPPESDGARLAEFTDAELVALRPEERFLLASYYLDGRTLAEIGRMLNVHESTIARRLEKITQNLRKRIIARLRAAGFSKHAAEEMLETDVRDVGVDVRRRLAQERQA